MAENIYTAINAVMSQVGYVKKQRSPNLNYSYAGEAALIAALRPEMVEQGIVVFVDSVHDVTTRDYVTGKGTSMVNVTLTVIFRFVHAPSQTYITVAARGEGMDTGDKANNKAMTCAYKYALRQTFMIETGDDPDRFQPVRQPAKSDPEAISTGEAAPVDISEDEQYAAARQVVYGGKVLDEQDTNSLKAFCVKFEVACGEGHKPSPREKEAYDAAKIIIAYREGYPK